MIPILTGIGGMFMRPSVIAGGIGAAVLGGFLLYHYKVTDASRERYIIRLEVEGTRKDKTIADKERANDAERKIVTELQATINDRNRTINEQALKMKTAELVAGVAAQRAFARGRAAAEGLRQPTTTVEPGDAAMNEWLAARFREWALSLPQ